MRLIYIIIITGIFSSCAKDEIAITVERGIHLYELKEFDLAADEFIKAIIKFNNQENLTLTETRLLSRANYLLALTYSKKEWWKKAKEHANIAFDLYPNEENKKILDLIKTRLSR
tara:strand:+ start:134 stop:478 length:345 start_codon:yes stop_codon:yes gene_type:complete